MKSGWITLFVCSGLLVVGLGRGFGPDDTPKETEALIRVVEVDELAEAPGKYAGEIVLRAAVARPTKTPGVLAVIDAREFKECNDTSCAWNYLPVRFVGEHPRLKTVVRLRGMVTETGKGLLFEAKSFEAEE